MISVSPMSEALREHFCGGDEKGCIGYPSSQEHAKTA